MVRTHPQETQYLHCKVGPFYLKISLHTSHTNTTPTYPLRTNVPLTHTSHKLTGSPRALLKNTPPQLTHTSHRHTGSPQGSPKVWTSPVGQFGRRLDKTKLHYSTYHVPNWLYPPPQTPGSTPNPAWTKENRDYKKKNKPFLPLKGNTKDWRM